MNTKPTNLSAVVFATLALPVTCYAGDWQFELEPYVFANYIDGDASVGRIEGADIDMNFKDDIYDNLDSTLMVHMEILHSTGWGAMIDYSYMTLKDDVSIPFNAELKTKTRQGVLEVDSFYRTAWGDMVLDYTAGFRWWDQDIDLKLNTDLLPGTPRVDIEEDWIDIVFGARLQKPLNDNWTLVARGDLGGFGLESDFTSQLMLGVKYHINDSFVLDANYKATWVDYDNGDKGQRGYFAYDTVTQGPVLGIIFQF